MFKLKNDINQKKNGLQIIEILFYTFPLSFVIGNLAISINTLLFIIASLIFIRKNQLNTRFNKSVWLLIIFFLYFFISTTIQYLYPGFLNSRLQNFPLEINPILKSFLLARFILLILVLDTLLYNKILNLRNFFLSSLICTSFVSFDVIFQYITGTDLFGYKNLSIYNSGPFGDELIAGSYLKNFSFFSLFFIFLSLKEIKFKNPLLVFILTSHLTATLVSGNRMPTILFIFGCFLLIIFIKNIRFAVSISLIFFITIFLLLGNNDKNLKKNYAIFLGDINILKIISKKNITDEKTSLDTGADDKSTISKKVVLLRHTGYSRVFKTSVLLWLEQPLTGFGLKSFRVKCWELLEKDNMKNVGAQDISCGNHPHNYYLEILSEAGIIGVVLIISFFIFILRNCFYIMIKIYQTNSFELILLTPVIIAVIFEIWPLRSTGSFFTNGNATFFWLIIGMLLSSNIKNSFTGKLKEKNT